MTNLRDTALFLSLSLPPPPFTLFLSFSLFLSFEDKANLPLRCLTFASTQGRFDNKMQPLPNHYFPSIETFISIHIPRWLSFLFKRGRRLYAFNKCGVYFKLLSPRKADRYQISAAPPPSPPRSIFFVESVPFAACAHVTSRRATPN